MKKPLLIAILLPFGALSVWAVGQVGLLALFTQNLSHPAGQQVFADLVIALSLAMVWIWHDARAAGRNPWPWLVATLAAGSFGPLVYLLTRNAKS
jgi:uncharacterized membrane protein YfcA